MRHVRVLLAEDDSLVGEMIQGLLHEMGYTIVGKAVDGRQVIEMATALKPDVILMDIKMPDMDGLEAARQLHEQYPLPVVVLTAYDSAELLEKASQVGVGAYLVKPSTAQDIDRAITIAIARFSDMREMRRLNAELKARNEELDAFAHTVAHDLQNPLSLIVGFAEMFREAMTQAQHEELARYAERLVWNGRKMSNIVDELLLLAEVRRLEAPIQPLDTAAILHEVLQRLQFMIETEGPTIILPPTWPVALGYAPWVEEVWVNYLSNAIKYGGRPAQVELGAEVLDDGMVHFWVRDNGPGLAPDEQSRLFTPFTQLRQVRARGHGLGLSIVLRIMEKLGGRVSLQSQKGSGSVFGFMLPAEQ